MTAPGAEGCPGVGHVIPSPRSVYRLGLRHTCYTTQRLVGYPRASANALRYGSYEAVDWVEYEACGTDGLYEVRTRMIVSGNGPALQFHGKPRADSVINSAEPVGVGHARSVVARTRVRLGIEGHHRRLGSSSAGLPPTAGDRVPSNHLLTDLF